MSAFEGVSRGLFAGRTVTLANTLAQERMESFKQSSYYRVMVTTNPAFASEPDIPSFLYDQGYYPSESFSVGGIPFQRRVYVEKVQDSGGSFVALPYGSPDTGIKRLTVHLLWQANGRWRTQSLVSLYSNPARQPLNGTFTGTVTSGGSNVADVRVEALQKTSWFDLTNSAGVYSFNVSAGTYTLRASKQGYFTTYDSNVPVAAGDTVTRNFSLTAMGTGTVRGNVWIKDHLVISAMVGSSMTAGGFDQEYVEIFNPTTWTWTVNGDVSLHFRGRITDPLAEIRYVPVATTVAPGGFYLFANTATLVLGGTSIAADAVWEQALGGPNDNNAGLPDFSPSNPTAISVWENGGSQGLGGLRLVSAAFGLQDRFGWKGGGTGLSPAEEVYESVPYDHGQTQGLNRAEQFVRYSTTAGFNSSLGPAYDSNNNDVDWRLDATTVEMPRNSATAVQPVVAGTPALGANISITDGLSAAAAAPGAGTPPVASFTVPGVATGTWSVMIASGTRFLQVEGVEVTQGATVFVPHAATTPTWPLSGWHSAYLTSSTAQGFIQGAIVDGSGAGISGKSVNASGASGVTNSQGRFLLAVTSGTHTVEANPSYSPSYDPTYITASSVPVSVSAGLVTSGVNFTLSRAGALTGSVTANGVDPLPDITVTAVQGGIEKGSSISNSDGRFTLDSLSTGTYTVQLQLDAGESASPVSPSATVSLGATTWVATFTVTNAMGSIRGRVKTLAGSSISTGVLVVATTSTISGQPPTDDSSLRSGGTLYYATSSLSDGTYELDVRGGATYNVYGWHTTWSGETPATSRRSGSAVVTAGAAATLDLTW
ncbi:MAG: carboxypeptidase regulatory-like domain-containing protein [Elusimicrobiota bacterium]